MFQDIIRFCEFVQLNYEISSEAYFFESIRYIYPLQHAGLAKMGDT